MQSVLVVDDEPTVRDLMCDILELEDYRTAGVGSGAHALRAFSEFNPDLVMLDVMMPGMTGLEVLRALREESEGETLPVILVSAVKDDRQAWEAWKSGASMFIAKPFSPDYLLSWVERLLSESKNVDSGMSCEDRFSTT